MGEQRASGDLPGRKPLSMETLSWSLPDGPTWVPRTVGTIQRVSQSCEASMPRFCPPPWRKVLTSFLGPCESPTVLPGVGIPKGCFGRHATPQPHCTYTLGPPSRGEPQRACRGPALPSQPIPSNLRDSPSLLRALHGFPQPQDGAWALPRWRPFPGRLGDPPSLCSLSKAGVHLPAGPSGPYTLPLPWGPLGASMDLVPTLPHPLWVCISSFPKQA